MLLSALFESTSIYLVVSFSDFGPVIPHSKYYLVLLRSTQARRNNTSISMPTHYTYLPTSFDTSKLYYLNTRNVKTYLLYYSGNIRRQDTDYTH